MNARSLSPAPIPAGAAVSALDGSPRFASRELSWLAFNRRVLAEAGDARRPLLERLKFLAIVSSNLDEFAMVRLAEVHAIAHKRAPGLMDPALDVAPKLLDQVREDMRLLVDDQYRCFRDEIAPALAKEGYQLVPAAQWSEADRESLRIYYRDHLEMVLTPLGVDPTRPFPVLGNRSLNVAVHLVQDVVEGESATQQQARTEPSKRNAIVAIPQGNRLIELALGSGRFALSEEVVLAFLDSLFPGFTVVARCKFRVTRDGALEIDEDQATDLLSEIEQELASREHSNAVRLEVAADGDANLRLWLVEAMDLDATDQVMIDGPLDLTMLFALADKIDRVDLRDKPLPAVTFPKEWTDAFATIRQGELLIHHPFQTYARVVELVEQAAVDPRVLAIKQTLYRVSATSPIVRALVRAARAGKQVTVLIELKARFDEATNIRWARALEEAGAHVVYGLVGYKVHAKLLMIIRREETGIRRYCHLGTGNYNDKTARLYTDLSYVTCNEAVGRDVSALFNMLTGYSQPPEWERLAVAPLTMRKRFVEWIRREADHARSSSGEGHIIAKFNSLVDEGICDELYAASQAGVHIQLIVRGMCILRPGVPGLSTNITVRSLVGRLLEHSRIYYFHNSGQPVVAISSADWMTRNLDRRVECLVRIEDPALRKQLVRILDIYLSDNQQARELQPDGIYRRLTASSPAQAHSALDDLLAAASGDEQEGEKEEPTGLRFRPRSKEG